MKKILLILLCMLCYNVQAQTIVEKYTSDHKIVSIDSSENNFSWEFVGKDSLVMSIFNNKKLLKKEYFVILKALKQENRQSYQVLLENKQSINITFWVKSVVNVVPMVAYEYSNGYVIYHGDVSY